MEAIDCFSKDEIDDLVCAIGNSLINIENPSVKAVFGSRRF